MKRPSLVRRAGPYRVESRIDGAYIITPTWEKVPGLMTRIALAKELQRWLNAPYEEETK